MHDYRRRTNLLALILTACLTGCWVGDTPAPELPEIDAGVGGGGSCNTTCDCLAGTGGNPASQTGLDGRVYRFTLMKIEEPYALAGLLNKKWSDDLRDDILNVLFLFDASQVSHTGYPARSATIRAASGWRVPGDIRLPPGVEVESYHVLSGTESTMTLVPNRECGSRCEMEIDGTGSLSFFAGSMDEPINCSPELTPQHVIPMTQLEAHFSFDEDCTHIVRGNLTACLESEAVKKICVCLGESGQCKVRLLDPQPPPTDDPNLYCARCGAQDPGTPPWASLDAVLPPPGSSPDLPPCDEPIGMGGYKVTGVFEAVDITDRFSKDGPSTPEGE